MIVGTAGHIDHGKTSLVRALTGVDTDRLPQEKARGISIELGYAFLPVPPAGPGAAQPGPIGFIDVPGHERLVHTMLAGATGIDFALLLVAADDGVMPQTREHLAVLSLLGVTRGLVALTKIDRVDAARRAAVEAEVRALLAPTPLAAAPVLAVSSVTGEGIDAVRRALFEAARGAAVHADDGRGFRLAIDRAFTIDGVGTVVTGTVHAGRVRIGDALTLVPDRHPVEARVRSLHAQNRPVVEAGPGLRCAVALAGLPRERITRGQWLVAPGLAQSTDRIDVELRLWHEEAKALRSGTPVHVHLGASDVTGSVAVLAALPPTDGDGPAAADAGPGAPDRGAADVPADTLSPGGRALVQLVLREPVGAWHGDRVVLRDVSATRTIAGGRVLDPLGPVRYRRTPQRLAELAAWRHAAPAARLDALVAVAPQGVDRRRWARSEGLVAVPGLGLASSLVGEPGSSACAGEPGSSACADGRLEAVDAQSDQVLGAPQAAALREAALAALSRFHEQQPEELGPDLARLRRVVAPRLPEPLWRAAVAGLIAGGRVLRRGSVLHLPEHGVRLSASEERIAQKVAPKLAQAGVEGAWARDLARETQEPEPLMRTTLSRLAQRGELHQVVRDLFYAPATIERLATIARETAQAGGGEVRAAAFRDRTGLGRKRAIQVLEYFDRVGVLRRVGDGHRLRADSTLFSGAAT